MLRVAFTRFYGPNSPVCQDRGRGWGGGQPNFGNARISGTFGAPTPPLLTLSSCETVGTLNENFDSSLPFHFPSSSPLWPPQDNLSVQSEHNCPVLSVFSIPLYKLLQRVTVFQVLIVKNDQWEGNPDLIGRINYDPLIVQLFVKLHLYTDADDKKQIQLQIKPQA